MNKTYPILFANKGRSCAWVLVLATGMLMGQWATGQQLPIEHWPECDAHTCGLTSLQANGLTVISELYLGDTLYFGPNPNSHDYWLCKREQLLRLVFCRTSQDTFQTVINWAKHLPENRQGFVFRNADRLTYLPKHDVALLQYDEGQPSTDWVGPVLLVFNLKTGYWIDIPFQKCQECHGQTPHFSPDSSHFTLPEGVFNLSQMAFTPHPRPQLAKVFSRFLSDSLYAVWHHGEDTDALDILRLPNTLLATYNAPLNFGIGLGLYIGFDPVAVGTFDTLVVVSNFAIMHPDVQVENPSVCG